jgi:uncharacterized alkaline shock family protein YloU
MASTPQQHQHHSALTRTHQWGRIDVFPAAVAAIAGHAALGCYGVMGMAARGLRDGFAQLLHRESAHRGVEVRDLGGTLAVDVYVIVQYGTRITEVAHNLQQAVRFEIERTVGVPVAEVNVNVQGVHEDSLRD